MRHLVPIEVPGWTPVNEAEVGGTADGGTAGSGRETQSSPGTSSGLGGMVGGQGPRGQRARSWPHLSCPRQGNTVELPEEENTPEKRVDRIFAMMDKVRPLV